MHWHSPVLLFSPCKKKKKKKRRRVVPDRCTLFHRDGCIALMETNWPWLNCLSVSSQRETEWQRGGETQGRDDLADQRTHHPSQPQDRWLTQRLEEKKQRDQSTVCPCPPEQLIRASDGRWLSNAHLPMVAMCGCLPLVSRLMNEWMNECRARRPLLWRRAVNPHYVNVMLKIVVCLSLSLLLKKRHFKIYIYWENV